MLSDQISIKSQPNLFIMSLFQGIESIEDHLVDANKDYELSDITFLTIIAGFAVLRAGKRLISLGKVNLIWLIKYRGFSHGIPTKHTIGRIIRVLKADSLNR